MPKRRRIKLQAMDHRDDRQVQDVRRDRGARRQTQLAGMRSGGTGIQVCAKMELRREKENSEQQGAKTQLVQLGMHVSIKTKLRLEWLRGQGMGGSRAHLFCNISAEMKDDSATLERLAHEHG